MARPRKTENGKRLATPQSVNAAVKGICDIMRRSNCAGALQYVPELTWILFLRILDEREAREAEEAEAVGADFTPSLKSPYRWRDWAAPDGAKRKKLQDGALGAFFGFVNGDLIPQLKALRDKPNAGARQKVLSEIFSGVERIRIDTERNLLDILDKVHTISAEAVDLTHVFTLSQIYEGLLLKMGEKGNDGGQFFTPREVIRAMVRVIDPKVGETVYDPGCGTGGFLAQAYEYMAGPDNAKIQSPDQLETLKRRTFYGREKDNAIYPIALANLVLHNIDEPHLWHGNTLTGAEIYGGLFQSAPALFDVILMNPPFGGKEGKEAQTRFAYKTGATQVLFLQHVIDSLKPGGRCGIVLDEGVLFRTNETAFVQTKRKLLDDCDLGCIVSLPPGMFLNAGAGVKTNLLFFTKGRPTEKVWYYDLSDIKVGKKTPFTIDRFDEFFMLLPSNADGDRSWTVTRAEIEARNFDIKAVNPHAKRVEDTRTPEELLKLIRAKGLEVNEALSALEKKTTVDTAALIAEWRRVIDEIHKDVVDIQYYWQMLQRLKEIASQNPRLQIPNLLVQWMVGNCATSVAVGIRRHTDRDPRSSSLYRLICNLLKSPRGITRKWFVESYVAIAMSTTKGKGLPEEMREELPEEILDGNGAFNEYADKFSEELDKTRLEADRDSLSAVHDKVGSYVNKRIAHNDPTGKHAIPTFNDLDESLKILARLTEKYCLLLHCTGRGAIPFIEPWEDILTFPWIERHGDQ